MARLGIYASQKAIDVTGNNIANLNTVGYSRQKTDQISLVLGGSDHYVSSWEARIGHGAMVTSVSQLRDPYLDIRYRNVMSDVGAMDEKLAGLQDIASVLDEVGGGEDGEGVLEAQFNDLMAQMQYLTTQGAGRDDYDTLVRSSTESLVNMFHDYANQLETLRTEKKTQLDQDITEVNDILESIRNLNESIRKSNIYGSDSLEQKDERNKLIDELSQYVRIQVTTEKEDLGAGLIVDKLVIKLKGNDSKADAKINNATLVDGVYATQLSIRTDADGKETENLDIDLAELKDAHGRTLEHATQNKKQTFNYDVNAAPSNPPTTVASGSFATLEEAQAALYKTEGDPAQYVINKLYGGPNGIQDGPVSADHKAHHFYSDDTKEKEYVYSINKNDQGTYDIIRAEIVRSKKVELTDNTLYGGLQSQRELLTEQGEFATKVQVEGDPMALTKRGYPYYQRALDALANKFAKMMNDANQTVKDVKIQTNEEGTEYKLIFDSDKAEDAQAIADAKTALDNLTDDDWKKLGIDPAEVTLTTTDDKINAIKSLMKVGNELTEAQMQILIPKKTDENGVTTGGMFEGGLGDYGDEEGGPLVTNLYAKDGADPTVGITASNFGISPEWASKQVRIITSTEFNAGSTANDNLTHLLSQLMNGQFEFTPDELVTGNPGDDNYYANPENGEKVYFKGTLQGMLTNASEILANDEKTTYTMLQNYMATSDEVYTDRDAVMGVDLNDETMNMIQFQKSYSAACRFLTTIDEMLDKLINGTGRAGL